MSDDYVATDTDLNAITELLTAGEPGPACLVITITELEETSYDA